MSKDALLFVVFGVFFIAPMMVAMAVGWVHKQWYLRNGVPADRLRRWRKRPPTTREELRCMAEYQRRLRRVWLRCWAGWLGGLSALLVLGLPLTGIALITLMPLLAVLEHLRCPACDSTPTLGGLTDGRHCLRCGTKLRV
jgi:hypothetical protein